MVVSALRFTIVRVSPVVLTSRGLTFTSARALVRAPIDGPDLPPTDTWDHTTLWSRCSHAHIGPVATACVSSPKDWAVHISSHMQQDVGISLATQRLGIPFCRVGSLQTLDPQIGENLPESNLSPRVFRPAGRLNVTENHCVHSHGVHAMERYRYSKVIRTRSGAVPTPHQLCPRNVGAPGSLSVHNH